MCTRHPVHRASSITSAMARFSAPRGREARKSAYRSPLGEGARSMLWASSACTIIYAPKRGDLAQCLLELYGVLRREFVDPGVQQEAFEPEHAGVV